MNGGPDILNQAPPGPRVAPAAPPAHASGPGPAPELDEERRLVERARDGDGAAFGALYDRHGTALYRKVLFPACAGNATVAQDLLQDTFMAALEGLGSYRWSERGIYPWLRAIGLNKARDHWRRTGQTERAARLLARLEAVEPPPRDAVEEEERVAGLRAQVGGVMAQLNPRYREALQLRLVDNQSAETCAVALGVSRSTFDVVLHRACKAFRRLFESGPSREVSS
ncbi:MAG: sigma-70 family RNA polymerase sigma factor [Candidatus Riflebacteria bacterium]|nr:sigma-70 family RNA polymerase sigma factor [Candidatus Riflebacteria bacterium]